MSSDDDLPYDVLTAFAREMWSIAASKQFHDEPVPVPVACANLHGEVSELWESYRKNELDRPCDKSEKMRALFGETLTCAEEELADILIRIFDTAQEMKIDLARATRLKAAYNRTRPSRNGGKIA